MQRFSSFFTGDNFAFLGFARRLSKPMPLNQKAAYHPENFSEIECTDFSSFLQTNYPEHVPASEIYRKVQFNHDAEMKGAAKFAVKLPVLDSSLLRQAIEWTTRDLYPVCGEFHVLSHEETISTMDRTTSVGYPFNLLYKDKGEFLDSSISESYFLSEWDALFQDTYFKRAIWACNLKSEIKKKKKLDSNDIRVFESGPIGHHYCLTRMFGGAAHLMTEKSMKGLSSVDSFVGTSKFSGGFQLILDRLAAIPSLGGKSYYYGGSSTDHSDFDKYQSDEVIFASFKILHNLMASLFRTHLYDRACKRLCHDLVHAMMILTCQILFMVFNGNKSGNAMTIFINNIVKMFGRNYIFLRYVSVVPLRLMDFLTINPVDFLGYKEGVFTNPKEFINTLILEYLYEPHHIQVVNSKKNLLLYKKMFGNRTLLVEQTLSFTYKEFNDNVVTIVNGDDQIENVSEYYQHYWNVDIQIEGWNTCFGIKTTTDYPSRCDIRTLDFLSQKFSLHELPGYHFYMYLPSPVPEKIFSSLRYGSKIDDYAWHMMRAFALYTDSWGNLICRSVLAHFISYMVDKYRNDLSNGFRLVNDIQVRHIMATFQTDAWHLRLYTGNESGYLGEKQFPRYNTFIDIEDYIPYIQHFNTDSIVKPKNEILEMQRSVSAKKFVKKEIKKDVKKLIKSSIKASSSKKKRPSSVKFKPTISKKKQKQKQKRVKNMMKLPSHISGLYDKEIVTRVYGTSDLQSKSKVYSWYLNPGNSVLFPKGSVQASLYQSCSLEWVRLHYFTDLSLLSTGTVPSGRVVRYFNRDPSEPDITNYDKAVDIMCSVNSRSFENGSVLHIDGKYFDKGRKKIFMSSNQPNPPSDFNLATSVNDYNYGKLQCIVDNVPLDSTKLIGELHIEAKWKFFDTKIPEATDISTIVHATSVPTTDTYFGIGTTNYPGSSTRYNASATGNVISLQGLPVGSVCKVDINLLATTTATLGLPSSFVGCTQTNYLFSDSVNSYYGTVTENPSLGAASVLIFTFRVTSDIVTITLSAPTVSGPLSCDIIFMPYPTALTSLKTFNDSKALHDFERVNLAFKNSGKAADEIISLKNKLKESDANYKTLFDRLDGLERRTTSTPIHGVSYPSIKRTNEFATQVLQIEDVDDDNDDDFLPSQLQEEKKQNLE